VDAGRGRGCWYTRHRSLRRACSRFL